MSSDQVPPGRSPTPSSRDVRQTIVHLLSNMSDGREIRSYLQRFSEVDRSSFAVIKIGGAILADHLEETAAALAFLHTVGLTPIVIHGGGHQLDRRLEERGIESTKIDGLRVTDPDVLDAARNTFIEQNIVLVEAIREQGVAAHGLTAGAFEADYVDRGKYGLVGEPTEVHIALIRSIVDSGAIPILTCLGVAPGGQIVNMNADSATRALVHAVQPLKIIFLVDVGGLLDHQDRVIESINLASDYDHLMAQEWVHSGMRLKLAEIKRLLDDTPLSTSVSITTPAGLVKELFTHGGSGTLVRKGELINRSTDRDAIDGSQVAKLVEEAFGRPLKDGWWAGLDLDTAYLSESLRAGAIVTRIGDIDYLDKFAILEDARGEGLARAVWAQLVADHPILYWRSRTENRFNSFYAEEADGAVKRGPWTVFWKGESDFARIAPRIEAIAALPPSFVGDNDE
ncbi:MAG TPA: acetylglutamate kinase [Acidimicrobiia bacterium]|nr:acetylglutamate kinase [Acidimicrobiia bacterium]